jgi:hypothetical protein
MCLATAMCESSSYVSTTDMVMFRAMCVSLVAVGVATVKQQVAGGTIDLLRSACKQTTYA